MGRLAPGRRRAPARRTGQQIVDAIVGGAERLLVERGLEGLTTAALASRAGVSVGSLYQYFADKRAVIAEIARRMEQRGLRVALSALPSDRPPTVAEAAAAFVAALCSPEMGEVSVRRAVFAEVPRGWVEDESRSADQQVATAVRDTLERNAGEVRDGDRALMAFVAQHAVEGVVEAVVARAPELLESERLQHELRHLVLAYLARTS